MFAEKPNQGLEHHKLLILSALNQLKNAVDKTVRRKFADCVCDFSPKPQFTTEETYRDSIKHIEEMLGKMLEAYQVAIQTLQTEKDSLVAQQTKPAQAQYARLNYNLFTPLYRYLARQLEASTRAAEQPAIQPHPEKAPTRTSCGLLFGDILNDIATLTNSIDTIAREQFDLYDLPGKEQLTELKIPTTICSEDILQMGKRPDKITHINKMIGITVSAFDSKIDLLKRDIAQLKEEISTKPTQHLLSPMR